MLEVGAGSWFRERGGGLAVSQHHPGPLRLGCTGQGWGYCVWTWASALWPLPDFVGLHLLGASLAGEGLVASRCIPLPDYCRPQAKSGYLQTWALVRVLELWLLPGASQALCVTLGG